MFGGGGNFRFPPHFPPVHSHFCTPACVVMHRQGRGREYGRECTWYNTGGAGRDREEDRRREARAGRGRTRRGVG